ncbi:reverse transcriptase family protein [Pseudomonas sp. Irchel s3h9]|uniref:reverse transcriptase family protein n=1 Tax=Pseudomonas sp. Irchel s3h9 TaxID=2009192 RepID=UPI0015ABE54E|nr:reverse transcriptase family protein [Pseudomonas sp. Irchel s3h9]
MQPKKNIRKKRKPDNELPIHQCALYKLGSPKRLADLLNISTVELEAILKSERNYKLFNKAVAPNPFTGKSRKLRAVQEPKSRLRQLHERILSLLRRVQYPAYVQGGVKHRSYQTNAAIHLGARQTATYDLKNFYGSTRYCLVHDFFHNSMCCPTDIAGRLASLTTWNGVMPTGSPLSPLLSFWAAKGLFDRCDTLAKKYGLNFTCYIDDLTFSGDQISGKFKSELKILVGRFGYELAKDKTKIFRFGVPAHITGVISHNAKLFVPHTRLKGIRKIQDAIDGKGDTYGFTAAQLKHKLAGTINEAASIDAVKYEKWAVYSRLDADDNINQ